MENCTLVIDQSTQGSKVILINKSGEILDKISMRHQQIVNEFGWISHNLDEIKQNIEKMCRVIIKRNDQRRCVDSVAITNQRETVAVWDRETGQSMNEAIVWQCSRAKCVTDKIKSETINTRVKQITGLELSPYFSAAKLAWFLQNDNQISRAIDESKACWGTIDTWLVFQLTNGSSYKTEPSNASRTQLMNLKTLDWDSEMCTLFGIKVESLPQIVDSNAIFGMTDLFGCIAKRIPITSVMGDSQAALYAHSQTKGSIKVTFGTGSSIMANTGSRIVQSKLGLNTSVGWRRDGKTSYVLEGNINNAGSLISWLQNDLEIISDPSETERMAEQANQQDTTSLIPAFTGLGTPYWKTDVKAALFGMTRITGKNEIVRACLNAIVFQIKDIIALIAKEIEIKSAVYVDGGMISNDYLMQSLSNVLRSNVLLPQFEELSACGTALNCTLVEKESREIKASYKPNSTSQDISELYCVWKEYINILIK